MRKHVRACKEKECVCVCVHKSSRVCTNAVCDSTRADMGEEWVKE